MAREILASAVGLWLLLGCGGKSADDGGGGSGGGEPGGGGGAGGAPQGGSGGEPAPGARPLLRFEPAADGPTTVFASVPFPSDLYRTAAGGLDLRGFPVPAAARFLLDEYIETIQEDSGGFATSGSMYLSFDASLDTARLPADGAASLAPGAPLFLVDVDPESPDRGQRYPLRWRFGVDATTYLPAHALSVRLVDGVVLFPSRTYALIVTDAIAEADPRFAATLADAEPADAALRAAWAVHAPLRAWLQDQADPPALAGAAVFTTQDPVGEMFRLRDAIHQMPAPELVAIRSEGIKLARFELIEGEYRAPRFQEGVIPYLFADRDVPNNTGAIRFGPDGLPIVQGHETIRFSMSIPLGETPSEGWPLVMYAHGTGGDWHSYVSGKTASVLARQGVACIAIDQIHHGTRDNGSCADAGDKDNCVAGNFFNFLVPRAGRDNVRQAALDYVSLLRFVRALDIPTDVTVDGRDVRLKTSDVMFMGHSQGGLNGPLFLAVEKDVRGGMLSGAGANFAIAVEQKKAPINIATLVESVLHLPEVETLDRWHPVVMLLQTFIEPADGHNYTRFWFRDLPPGYPPRSVFMTVGLRDEYAPPDGTHALAASAGVPIVDPVAQEVEALTLQGVMPTFPPYRGNVAEGRASAGLAQYPREGHFLIMELPDAQNRYARFLHSLATTAVPEVF